jgi:predicted RNase H-like HicB family nuclease
MFTMKLKKDGKYFHAFCPELKGCHTFGKNRQEALTHLKEAMMLHDDANIQLS